MAAIDNMVESKNENTIVFMRNDDSLSNAGAESTSPDFAVHKLKTKIKPPEKMAEANK